MLVLYVLILLLPPAGAISMILRSSLRSISEVRGASFVFSNTFATYGVSCLILRSILCSILDARGAIFVCFNSFATFSWG